MNILLCTLGASWAVIPEIFGWLAPDKLPLYAHHPDRVRLDEVRSARALQSPDELWICTTEGKKTVESLERLRVWWSLIGAPIPLRIWTAAGTDQLATQTECDHVRELTLRSVMAASERIGSGGQLIVSLAGGRKTMSADLQWAGSVFGATAWLHVVGPEPLPAALFAAAPETFCQALPAEVAAGVTPLVAGTGQRSELLDIDIDGRRIALAHFPLPLAAPHCAWQLPPDGPTLSHEIQRRERESGQLLGNFLSQIAETEHHENWRSLYRLPPAQIDLLRRTRLAPEHRETLLALPKADLHRHLGGCLSRTAQLNVGQAIADALTPAERREALDLVGPLLRQTAVWDWDWPRPLTAKGPRMRAACTAMLLTEASPAQLELNVYAPGEARIALKKKHARGFSAYERPGELSGSAVLGHPAAVGPYAAALVAQSRAEGLLYTELRGSPHKYWPNDPASFVCALQQALQAAGANDSGDPLSPRFGFIWILDRRHPEQMQGTIECAITARERAPKFLLGLDLAGDEGTQSPQALAPYFIPAFRECMPITIHAGEGESADNIWQAAYHLHADRIGHGLSLAENPALTSRFRDRGICLELCPSSNREVVGFFDPEHAATADQPRYPLRRFIDAGLPLTLCTDNPGISQTTLADEYLVAARMSDDGITLWEALALIKQGFARAFLPADARETLLKQADRQILAALLGGKLAAAGTAQAMH
jgi:adenosine deaminase